MSDKIVEISKKRLGELLICELEIQYGVLVPVDLDDILIDDEEYHKERERICHEYGVE